MKRVLLTILVILLVAAAGIEGYFLYQTSSNLETSTHQLNEMVGRNTDLNMQLETVKFELSKSKDKITSLNLKEASLLDTLKNRGEEVNRLTTEKTQLSKENYLLISTKNQLTTRNENLEVEVTRLGNELQALRKFYPPKYFSDYNQLRDWLASGPIGTIGDSWESHLRAQRLALESGYIWSVILDRDTLRHVSCVIAGDSIYWVFGDGTIEWISWR